MKNTARIAEHPLHPMLIPFPIGLFVTSFIFDLIYLGTGQLLWYQIAYYMILAGIIGGLLAAIPGFVDYFTMRMSSEARSTATKHMLLNLAIVVLFIVNLGIRFDNAALAGAPLAWAIILSVVSLGMLAYSGWLGWMLIYKHGIAVSLEDAQREQGQIGAVPGGAPRLAGQMGGERPTEEEQPPPS